MPKIGSAESVKLRKFVKEYGEEIFTTDNKCLLCKCCCVKVNHSKKYFIQQHIQTDKHKHAVKLNEKTKAQHISRFTDDSLNKKNEFFLEITQMLIACDIPLYKIQQPQFKKFIEKHTNRKVPADSSLLRKVYLSDVYESVLEQIRFQIGENNIFVSIDETTDKKGRFICNVVVGALKENGRSFLLTVEVVDRANASTIATVFDNALQILWPEGVKRERVLVFVTDAARYMKKSGEALKLLYRNMIHVTCVAHGIHRVCETIRSQYTDVDAFIANVKKIFTKSASRLSIFKEMEPNLPLPPKPVLTRWGTWLSAAIYYAKYYQQIKGIILCLDEDAASITFAKELMSNSRIPEQLAYINANFNFLVEPNGGILSKLQKRNAPITEIFDIINFVDNRLKDNQGVVAKSVQQKFKTVFEENKGFQDLKNIAEIITGSNTAVLPMGTEIKNVENLKWSPLVSCEVERSFSCFKAFLRDNRMSFLPENIKKHLVPLCFYNNVEVIQEIL